MVSLGKVEPQRPGSRSRMITFSTCPVMRASRSVTAGFAPPVPSDSRYPRAIAGSRAHPPRISPARSATARRVSNDQSEIFWAGAPEATKELRPLCSRASVTMASRIPQDVSIAVSYSCCSSARRASAYARSTTGRSSSLWTKSNRRGAGGSGNAPGSPAAPCPMPIPASESTPCSRTRINL